MGQGATTSAEFARKLAAAGKTGVFSREQASRILQQHAAAAGSLKGAAGSLKGAAGSLRSAASAGRSGSRPGLGTSNLAVNALVDATRLTNGVGYGQRLNDYNRALNLQNEALRRLAAKQAFNTYQSQARELQSVGYNAPSNPYRGYRNIQGSRYAEGGFVTKPTNATIGEAGESEYVIPASKMDTAIKRYAKGARGESVTEGGGTKGGKSNKAAVVNVNTGPVMRMNNQDYVTVNDMNSALGNVMSAMSSDEGNYDGSARLG